MLSSTDCKAKAILKATDLFSFDFVKAHIDSATTSYCDLDQKTARFFIGFTTDDYSKKWNEFVYMEVDKSDGRVVFLDFRLPNGYRMGKPIDIVRSA